MKKYLDLTTWILLFALAPLTILVLLSQNSIPGDAFYPVKRGLENIILAAATVSPSTRVAFKTDLTQRRFAEAQQLLVQRGDTAAFTDFVTEVSSTQQDLSVLSNTQDKIKSSEKLIAKIDEYQTQLAQAQAQVQLAQAQIQTQIPSQTPTPVGQAGSNSPSSAQAQPSQSPQPVQRTNPVIPTAQPVQTSVPTPTQIPQMQTPSMQPSSAPNITSTIVNNPQKASEVATTIDNTKKELEKIKHQAEQDKADAEFKQKVQEEENKIKEHKTQETGNEPTASPGNK